MIKTFLFYVLILSSSIVHPQVFPGIEWDRNYGGSGMEWAYSSQQTLDGGYIIVGRSDSFGAGNFDAWLVKTDQNGDTLWTKTYGDSYIDEAYQVKQAQDGNYFICGLTTQFGWAGEGWVIKTNVHGDIIWNKGFHSDQGSTADWDYLNDICPTSDGGAVVTGYCVQIGPYGPHADGWILKLNSSGTAVWNKRYGSDYDDRLMSIQQTSDGGFIAAGNRHVNSASDYDAWIVKFNSTGDTLWSNEYGTPDGLDFFWDIKEIPGGGYILAGETQSYGAGGYKSWIVRIDQNGSEIWNKTYGPNALFAIQPAEGGNFIAGGTILTTTAFYDALLIKTDAMGNVLWSQVLSESGWDDMIESIGKCADGGYILGGRYNANSAQGNYWLALTENDTPVELVSFTAQAGMDNVILRWQTGSETNNKGFEIQRSNESGDFIKIGFIPGNGTTARPQYYSFTDNNLNAGKYHYQLIQVDYNGTQTTYPPVDAEVTTPGEFYLAQNYPNPFNPGTTIRFSLPAESRVTLDVVNVVGETVRVLLVSTLQAGTHSVDFNSGNLPGGIYFYRISAEQPDGKILSSVNKMVLLK